MIVMKSLDQKADDELEEQVLCAMAEAIARGRHFDEVCRKIIEIVNDVMSNDDVAVSLSPNHPQAPH